jgi:peptide/nickel transport system ATP-binding protein
VRHLCDRLVVLYLGRVMEEGPAGDVFEAPHHPYTSALLSAAPTPDPDAARERIMLRGDVPSPSAPPSGCVFRTRCPKADEACAQAVPPFLLRGEGRVACIRPN